VRIQEAVQGLSSLWEFRQVAFLQRFSKRVEQTIERTISAEEWRRIAFAFFGGGRLASEARQTNIARTDAAEAAEVD
jgi:hypothetical protein